MELTFAEKVTKLTKEYCAKGYRMDDMMREALVGVISAYGGMDGNHHQAVGQAVAQYNTELARLEYNSSNYGGALNPSFLHDKG